MPTRRVHQSRAQPPPWRTAKKSPQAGLPSTNHPTGAKPPSAKATHPGVSRTPAEFTRATRKLLTGHAEELQRVITEGRHFAPQDYSRLVRDLEMLQAAAKNIMTD